MHTDHCADQGRATFIRKRQRTAFVENRQHGVIGFEFFKKWQAQRIHILGGLGQTTHFPRISPLRWPAIRENLPNMNLGHSTDAVDVALCEKTYELPSQTTWS